MTYPSRKNKYSFFEALKTDGPASIVVFLVALPLSIGIAEASNAPLSAGLIAGVIGGLVASWFGGTPLQISGPAAGLTVVVADLVIELGDWKLMCFVTVTAGILQFIFGLTGLSRAVLAIAPTVVHAMLAGIGITIALQQIHILLGGDSKSSAWNNLISIPAEIKNFNFHSMWVGILVIAIILLWPKFAGKLAIIPGSLVGIVIAVLFNKFLLNDSLDTVNLGNGNFLSSISLPSLPKSNWQVIIVGILTVAIITSVESLLSSVAVDKMNDGPRSNFDRELVGQGIANVTSGMLGGLPITGVIVRSATNIKAGAKTRLSGMLHGIWILVFALFFSDTIELVPTCALAALLVVVGIQLVKIADIREAFKTGNLLVYLVTLLGVVFLNLLEGVLLGLGLSIFFLLKRIANPKVKLIKLTEDEDKSTPEWLLIIRGTASFLASPRITSELAKMPPKNIITIDMHVDFIDQAAFETIENWKNHYEQQGGTVIINVNNHINLDQLAETTPKKINFKNSPLVPILPWKPTPSSKDEFDSPALAPIQYGMQEYVNNDLQTVLPYLQKLKNGQEPKAVFITCGDSRVVPNMITSSGPGDLFTIRNVGNIVPIDDVHTSAEAGIEYAVTALKAPAVIVCGHSSCGAMNGLLNGLGKPGTETKNSLENWLRQGYNSLLSFKSGHPIAKKAAKKGFSEVDQLSFVNVVTQVEAIKKMPAIKTNNVAVKGMFFDIASGTIVEIANDYDLKLVNPIK